MATFAVIQNGYCIFGQGNTIKDAVCDANDFLEQEIEINEDGDLTYCGEELPEINNDLLLSEDGLMFITKNQDIIDRHVI